MRRRAPLLTPPRTGDLGTATKTEYGTITALTIDWQSDCGNDKNVVWGDNGPPTTATRVEVNCIHNP